MTAVGEEPPKEPMCLTLSCLYGSSQEMKDKKIQSFITEHCCRCPAFEDGRLHEPSSQCGDKLCVYIHWYYRHYWLKHKRLELTCSGCGSCSRLQRWIVVHSCECLKQQLECCLSLCKRMKQSQHLSNLSRADHNFMSQIASSSRHGTPSQPPNSLPTLGEHTYSPVATRSEALLAQNQYGGDALAQNMIQQNGTGYFNHSPHLEEQRMLQHSVSAVCLSQGGKQMPPLSHPHSHSYANMQAQQNNHYSDPNSSHVMADSDAHVDPLNGQYRPQQWTTGESNRAISSTSIHMCNGISVAQEQYSTSMCNGVYQAPGTTDVNGVLNTNNMTAVDALTSSTNNLGTPSGDPSYKRQISIASSGYGTASSTGTGRPSVISRDQSLIDVDPENSLHVNSTPYRKVSAPAPPGCNHRTKKMPSQQSHSLTDLSQNIPEYPYDNEENGHVEECKGHPSLQRQDTGHATKVVFAGLEDSISGEKYQSMMGSKQKMLKQTAIEEATESSPSPPVTKRPLQRKQSDLSGKDKIVFAGDENRCGSNSLTRYQYDSIFKFQEQRGILSDQETREKVLGKQRRQAAVAERPTRRGTVTSDIPSDFDTESSTSDIPGSSPLTSSEFSDPEDLTDQEEEKKAAQTERTEESKMTVEEQIKMIQAMKAGKVMSLPINRANVSDPHQGRTRIRKQHVSHTMQSPSLPPEMVSTYAPSDKPLHSLPQGSGPTNLTSTNSSSSVSDGASTLENERLSSNTLKEEENCYCGSTRFSIGSCGPATHSSTDGSTLTGGSFEGKFTSLRFPSSTSSERPEDVLAMVNSPSTVAAQSSLSHSVQGQLQREFPVSSPMDMDTERSSYYVSQSEEVQSMESDVLSPGPALTPSAFQPGRYKLPSSQVQQMCQRVDDVKEMFQDELLRIRHKDQLMRQGAPDTTHEEQRRNIPGYRIHVDKHHDSNTLYRGHFSRDCPESSYPELERHYYKKSLQQQFPETEEEVAVDVERRYLLKKHLLGKFHSGNAYREGVHWHRKTQLGKGGQAQCYSIQDVKTQMIMALKEEKEDHKTLDEAFVCMKLSYLSNISQNIVDYYCAALLPKEYNLRGMSLIQVFMEMVPACLHAYLHDNGPFGIEDLHHFGYQLFDALDYLHSTLRIIHCDVKPANLLLDYTAQRLKLTDFGFAQILDQYSSEVQSDENAGTLSYNPPEHYREKCCSFALDIWQAGCTLLTMATGRRPWRHLFMDVVRKDKPIAYIQALRRGQANMIGQQTGGHVYPAFLDDSLKKLLYGCLCHNPQSRLSAQDCVYHLNWAMAGTPHMNEQHRTKIVDTFGHWRSPPPVFSTYNQDARFVDVYLDTTRQATIEDTKYTLCAGWLGCVPYQQGMNVGQLEDTLPQHFPVLQHISPFALKFCENSPQALFMKATEHPVNLTFEPSTSQSLVDRTKAVVISVS